MMFATSECCPVTARITQLVIAETVKGRGVRRMEGDYQWHVGNLVGADYEDVVAEIENGLQPLVAGGADG